MEAALRRQPAAFGLARRDRLGKDAAQRPLTDMAHSFEDTTQDLPHRAWRNVTRYFRDGHTEQWWAAELEFFGYGPHRQVRVVVATTDPATLPPLSTCYLSTNLPVEKAPLAHLVWLYGLRVWIEEHYKRIKHELGWAEFMVRAVPCHSPALDVGVVCVFVLLVAWSTAGCCAFTESRFSRTQLGVGKIKPLRRPVLGCWPQTSRRVRSWPDPWKWLNTCWHTWHDKPPPPELAELLAAVTAGLVIDLHLRE